MQQIADRSQGRLQSDQPSQFQLQMHSELQTLLHHGFLRHLGNPPVCVGQSNLRTALVLHFDNLDIRYRMPSMLCRPWSRRSQDARPSQERKAEGRFRQRWASRWPVAAHWPEVWHLEVCCHFLLHCDPSDLCFTNNVPLVQRRHVHGRSLQVLRACWLQ